MEIAVVIKGTDEVINRIHFVESVVDTELGRTMVEVVNDVMTDAKYFAPVATGFLRDHITGQIISRIRGLVIVGRVRSSARYSIFQEYGWSGQPEGHPYLYPALLKNQASMFEKFKRAMDTAITKASVGKYYGGGKEGIKTETII